MADISLFGLGFDYTQFNQGVTQVERGVDSIEQAFDRATAASRSASEQLASFAQGLRALGPIGAQLSIGVTAPLTALGVASVRAATTMDSLTRGLQAVSGSSAETEKALGRLREVAKLPGLSFKEAVRGATNLQAAGLSAQLSERALRAFGNALATVGKGSAELSGVTLALSQIQSKGKVSAEEINQLAERVPQIRRAMIQAFGTADTEVLQKAKITSQKFLDTIVTELEKLPAVTGGAQTTFENLSDSYEQSIAKIGAAGLRILAPTLEQLAPAIDGLGSRFAALSPTTRDVALKLGLVAAATGPVIYGTSQMLGALGQLTASAKAARDAFSAAGGASGLLGVLASANPILLAVAGAATAGGIVWYEYQQRVNAATASLAQFEHQASRAAALLGVDPKEAAKQLLAQKRAREILAGQTAQPTLPLSLNKQQLAEALKNPLARPDAEGEKKPEPLNLTGKTGRGGGKAAASEAREIQQALAQIEREGIEARLRVEQVANEERQRGLKERFDEGLISTRTFYDQQLTITLDGLNAQIAAIDAKREQLERQLFDLPKNKKGGKSNTVESLRIDAQLIQLNTQEFEKQAAALKAIAENAQAYKKALGVLAGPDLSRQEQVRPDPASTPSLILDARQRLGKLRGASAQYDVLDAQLARDEVAIQNQVNAGLLNEAQAKSAILATQRRYRAELLESLQARKELAEIENDPAAVANLERQIAALRGLGAELSAREEFFRGLKSQSQTSGEQAYALGQDVRGAVRNSVVTGLREGGRAGALALVDSLETALTNYLADQLTDALFDGLGKTKLFRTPDFNPNAKKTASQSAGDGLADKINEALGLKDEQLRGVDRHLLRIEQTLAQIERNTENSASCCRSSEERATQERGPSLLQQILGTVAGALVSTIAGGLGGGSGGAESGAGYSGAPAGGYFTGSHGVPLRLRANGGPVTAGEPYLVGERGPELYVPNNMGYIVPNNRLPVPGGFALAAAGGGTTINMNVEVHLHGVQDARGFERSAAQIANEAVRQVENAQRFR